MEYNDPILLEEDPLFEDTPSPSHDAEEETALQGGSLFRWCPPNFLLPGEDDEDDDDDEGEESEMTAALKADVRAALGCAADERDVEAIIAQRLSEYYRIIDNQQMQIHRLREEIDRMFVAEHSAQKERQCREKSRRILQFWGVAIVSLTVSVVFHREISQVGWNALQGAASVFGLSPQGVVGFLTSATVVWLCSKVARSVWDAALEDLMEEKEGSDDLFDC